MMKKTIKIVTSLILAVLVILLAFVLLKGCGSSKVDKRPAKCHPLAVRV